MRYKLITDRNVGLFSNVYSVLGTIDWCEENGEVPAVRFDIGPYLASEHGPNWWEYYFERLSDIDPMVLPVTLCEDQFTFATEMARRVVMKRHRTAEIIRRHIRIRPELNEHITAFWQRHMSGRFVVGFHAQGADKILESPHIVIEDTLAQIETIVRDRPPDSWRIFVATDEISYLDCVKERFGNQVIYQDAIRGEDSHAPPGGPRAASNLNIERDRAYRIGLEAVQDALLLSRCDVFFGCQSNLSYFVAACNPEMPWIGLVGEATATTVSKPPADDLTVKELIAKEAEIQQLKRHSADLKRQLHVLEQDVVNLRNRAYRSRSWRARLRPTLFNLNQYPPRDWSVPQHYTTTTGPLSYPPGIAIVTPSFNQGPFLARTIRSVLDQNYPALRYTVQDGGSTDETHAVLDSFRGKLSWTTDADKGQAEAINRGFARVEGDIMAWLNSDDMLLPGTLAYVARFFLNHPKIDVVYGHRICIDKFDKEVGRIILPRHDPKVIKWVDYIPQETMFWRRRVWDKLGGIDPTFHFAMDWDFILRAHTAGFRFFRLPRFLGCFRVHRAQKTRSLSAVGESESAQLRLQYLGKTITHQEIDNAIRAYLRRHVLAVRAYKLHLARY